MSNRLHLVIGYDGPRSSATPTVIYCGRDGDEARAAMEPEAAYAVKKWVRNPRGVRKVNDSFDPSQTIAPATRLLGDEESVKTWDEIIEENETLRAELAELKTKFQSADPQGLENEAPLDGTASGESGSLSGGTPSPAESESELPAAKKAGNGEGDLPVAQAAAPVAETGKEKDASAEASRGSMSPKKKAK